MLQAEDTIVFILAGAYANLEFYRRGSPISEEEPQVRVEDFSDGLDIAKAIAITHRCVISVVRKDRERWVFQLVAR